MVMLRYVVVARLRCCVVVVKRCNTDDAMPGIASSCRIKENNFPPENLSTTSYHLLSLINASSKHQHHRTPLHPSATMASSSNVPDRGRLSNLNPQTPLFNLSGELRNALYRLVLPTVPTGYKVLVFQATEPNGEPAILQANKQIRSEAASLYYSNIFQLEVEANSLYVLADWAAPLARTDFANLRHLEIVFWIEGKYLEQGIDEE
jgi:hypothetical protein